MDVSVALGIALLIGTVLALIAATHHGRKRASGSDGDADFSWFSTGDGGSSCSDGGSSGGSCGGGDGGGGGGD